MNNMRFVIIIFLVQPIMGNTDTSAPNCEVLQPGEFNLHWFVDNSAGEIEITMNGLVPPGDYMAFGISGSELGSSMTGSDVTVGWVEPMSGGFAKDYYLSAQEQVSLIVIRKI